jgi:hypothetical protein
MRRGLLLAIVLVLGSAAVGFAAPHPRADTIRRVCELGHPCHHCPRGEWWCGSVGKCIPNNQGCQLR